MLELELLLGKKIPESHEEQERVRPKSSRGRRGRGGDQTTVVQFAPSILQTPSPVGRKKKNRSWKSGTVQRKGLKACGSWWEKEFGKLRQLEILAL